MPYTNEGGIKWNIANVGKKDAKTDKKEDLTKKTNVKDKNLKNKQ